MGRENSIIVAVAPQEQHVGVTEPRFQHLQSPRHWRAP
jgi:hypothetical protein